MKTLIALIALLCLTLAVLGFTGLLDPLFSANYLPHRYCYLAKPGLIWTNVAMDALIASSYALIFACMLWITRRLRHSAELRSYLWIFLAFGVFIGACGATHFMEVVTVWWPVYPFAAAVKVVCAVASIPTAVLFAKATPKLTKGIIHFIDVDAELRAALEELKEFSAHDALTNLRNRGSFDAAFASEWLRAVRTEAPISVLLMDVDHFKMLNDRYGHLIGDECLRRVAQMISARRGRPEDVTARYGGEEFALLLPGSDLASAYSIAEEIRQSVLSLQIPHEDSLVDSVVTLSIGVASHVPKQTQNPQELLAAADAALYRAKRLGRNRTEKGHDLVFPEG